MLRIIARPSAACEEDVTDRLELRIVPDAGGRPDPSAWAARQAGWAARLNGREGDLVHDAAGWLLRLAEPGAALDDMPAHAVTFPEGILRPGAVLGLRAPDGAETAWMVVAVE